MILTGPQIEAEVQMGRIEIEPFIKEHVGPNSVDLRLAPQMKTYLPRFGRLDEVELDALADNPVHEFTIGDDGCVLHPGVLYLGCTMERTFTPMHVPRVEGRSSVGRLGIEIHRTACFGDVGFNGRWTLEITVVHPVRVYAGMRIGQVYFSTTLGQYRPYDGRYQGDTEPTASRFYQGEQK